MLMDFVILDLEWNGTYSRRLKGFMNEIIEFGAVKVNEETAAVSLRLPGSLGEAAEDTCQNLLTGMMIYFSELHNEYPQHIEVLEAE